jgi:hypothetical protein
MAMPMIGTAPAIAAPTYIAPIVVPASGQSVIDVQYRQRRHYRSPRRSYRPRRHYRSRRGDAAAAALLGGLAAGAIIGGALASPPATRRAHRHDAHIEWCLARYRSYDVYSDTFQPYHGPRRPCLSPYR